VELARLVLLEVHHDPVLQHAALDDDEQERPILGLVDDVEIDEHPQADPKHRLAHAQRLKGTVIAFARFAAVASLTIRSSSPASRWLPARSSSSSARKNCSARLMSSLLGLSGVSGRS
jgi:hypothetical protein